MHATYRTHGRDRVATVYPRPDTTADALGCIQVQVDGLWHAYTTASKHAGADADPQVAADLLLPALALPYVCDTTIDEWYYRTWDDQAF